jgi:hypothetical protein
MKRLALYIATALLSFAVGAVAATLWSSHQSRPQTTTVVAQPVTQPVEDEEEWPLRKQIVSRSLQTHSFSTDKLRKISKNTDDGIVWRWLKQEIARYPQDRVPLNISDSEDYGVVLYPIEVLEPILLNDFNRELNRKGLPTLEKDKRYLRIHLYKDNTICPNWTGYIDVEEARLVYFRGEGI